MERVITRHCLTFLNARSHVTVDCQDERLASPVNAVSVLRARLDPRLAGQCERATQHRKRWPGIPGNWTGASPART